MKKSLLLTCMISVMSVSAQAVTVLNVDLTANGSSRVYDYFSNGYAQVDLEPDGMYDIDTNNQLGGDLDVFPSEGNWNSVGSLSLDGDLIGSGSESFNITDATFDFAQYISGTFSVLNDTNYTTTLAINSGSASFTDGLLTSLSLDADVSFTFQSGFGPGVFSETSGLILTESSFDLDVDDQVGAFVFVRHQWDADGTASIEVVPEPSTYALLAVGAAALALLRRSARK
ncbi:MAG: PEP-CTERM sorting domain-containing protein [Verrucomicrobiota bacterium]